MALDGFIFQERDGKIIHAFLHSRMMTLRHVAELFFDGKVEGAKKRVQKLKELDYVREDRPSRFAPAMLFLGKSGLKYLRETGVVATIKEARDISLAKRMDVSEATRRHELSVMDIKCAFMKAIRARPDLELAEFSTWTVLNQFSAPIMQQERHERVSVFPDAFIRIRQRESDGSLSESMFFLELDMGTEPQKELARRATAYLAFYQSGGMAVRCGHAPAAYREFPFRVLYVFPSEERLKNAAKRFLENDPPIRSKRNFQRLS